jgi:hypothetical protein
MQQMKIWVLVFIDHDGFPLANSDVFNYENGSGVIFID